MKNFTLILYVACFLIANPLHGQSIEIYKTPFPAVQNGFTTADGKEWRLGKSATQLRIVNFWALWCPPCVKELKSLSQLKRMFSKDELDVVTIATGKHRPETVNAMFLALGVGDLPQFFDQNSKLALEFGAPSVPYTVLLDADGKEIGRIIGAADWDSTAMIDQIRALLKTLK